MRLWRIGVLEVLVSGVLTGADLWAQTAAPTTEDCQACHAESSMARADGRPVVVPADVSGKSVHAVLSCADCHADLAKAAEFPHPERLAPVDCATCHDEPATGFARSAHGMLSGKAALQCASCHGPPHQIRPSSDFESPTHKLQTAGTCATCHGGLAGPGARRGPAVAGMFADSIHAMALERTTVAPTCTDCHRSHEIVRRTDPKSPVHPPNIPATCGTCHTEQHRVYGGSVHAELLAGGDARAPQCASCHTAHRMIATASDAWQLGAVEQCGTCHREALATYRDSVHGQVTALGFTPVAKCADCHESHQIVRVSDARSTVAPANRLATCRTCHPSATANFAQFQPHANKRDPGRSPALYYAALFMDGLLLSVFLFFGTHTVLWFVRERVGPPDAGGPRG